MDRDSSVHGRAGVIIVVLVVVGMVVLGAGGYLAWSKRHRDNGGSTGSEEASRWCQLRQEWQRKADPLAADIMLKSVKDEDRADMEQLMVKRNKLGIELARRLEELHISEPAIARVEEALVKEAKARANLAVEIHNAVVKEADSEDLTVLNKMLAMVRDQFSAKITEAKASANRAVAAGLAAVGVNCPGLYRGQGIELNTAESPYITWDEVEMRRARAEKLIAERVRKLEPLAEYTNRVYHELVRQYRPVLVGCYKKARARSPKMSETLGLRVRLKRGGEVKTLAIEWMDNREESFLDCLLEKASKWKLPRPDAKTEVVVVTLDFSKI